MQVLHDELWSRDKIKSYIYFEIAKNVATCMNANFETLVATHPAPYLDAKSPLALAENRAHASGFQALVLGSARKLLADKGISPPFEWLQAWIKHGYAVGGAPRVRTFLLCSEYPENARLEWLRRTLTKRRDDVFSGKDSADILAIPSFSATILLFRLLSQMKTRPRSSIDYIVKDLYGHEGTGVTYETAIELYAPALIPYWGTITLLGLDFPQAHALVFGEFEKSEEPAVEIDFAIE